MVSEFIKCCANSLFLQKNRGPTILTELGAHQTPQSTWWFCNTNICYPGCLHSHLMQTMPPCRSNANEHSLFNRIPISHAVPTCPVWLITHNQTPALHSRCGPCLLIKSPLQVETIFLCLRTYLELPSVNLHCRAHICFMRFYLIKSRENKKLIPGSIKPQTSKISRHFIHQLPHIIKHILERKRGLKKQKQK